MINNFLEAKAEEILTQAGCFELPVNIHFCAKYLKVEVNEMELDNNVSGFLVLDNDNNAHIGCNAKHGYERKRFTIAHELSHYLLHAKKDLPLFIDKNQKPVERIMFRDASSSTGEFIREREANALAAAFLMPKKLVEEEIKKYSTANEDAVFKLAEKFNVSVQAMNIRLINLDIIDYNIDNNH